MIKYGRTTWYGLGYLLRCTGSLIPRAIPLMVLAGSLAGVFTSGLANDYFYTDPRDFFNDPYSISLIGVVFGYLSVARLNMCYNRYWEGVSHIKSMYSKWSDAFSQAIVLDRIESHGNDLDEP